MFEFELTDGLISRMPRQKATLSHKDVKVSGWKRQVHAQGLRTQTKRELGRVAKPHYNVYLTTQQSLCYRLGL